MCKLNNSAPTLLPYSTPSLSPAHPPPPRSSNLPSSNSFFFLIFKVTVWWLIPGRLWFPPEGDLNPPGDTVSLRLDSDSGGKTVYWRKSHAQGRVDSEEALVGVGQKRLQLLYWNYCSGSKSCLPLTAIWILIPVKGEGEEEIIISGGFTPS